MTRKPLYWLGSSLRDLRMMPDPVKREFGYALDLAQQGKRHLDAKPFHIDGESGLIEVVENFDGDTYRAIYTVKFQDAVYVLHCFQKKSTRGIKTSLQDVNLVVERLRRLKAIIAKGE